jgi:CheY-like chemotaxis protein
MIKKILIIDDDVVFTKTLQDYLPKEKYQTFHAKDGVEGLEIIEKENLDLIILDLLMPRMGGMEFLDEFRQKKLDRQIPILISSQLSKIEDISKAIVAGMDVGVKGYVIKASENLEMIVREIEKTIEKFAK